MKHAKSMNQSQMRHNNMGFLAPQDNIRGSGKSNKLYDLMSVIQDGGDSYASGEQLLQEFKQFGLQTVVIHDESFQKLPQKQSNKSITPHPHYYHSNKNLEVDDILDFSNMVRAKQKHNKKLQNSQNLGKHLKKLKNLKINIKDTKNLLSKNLLLTNKQLSQIKQQYQQSCSKLLNFIKQKLAENTKLHEKDKQNLKNQIKQLKLNITHLVNKNNKLSQQKNILQHQYKQSRITNKEEKPKQQQMSGLQILSYNIKINEQISKQFQKHSQKLKQTNKQIQQLNDHIETLNEQNKILKQKIEQYEKQLKTMSSAQLKNSQNLSIYNEFLDKISQLQQQINQLRKSQKIQRKQQIAPNLQLTQINQFLVLCEQKERDLLQRQKQISRKQKQINLRNIHYDLPQYRKQQVQKSPKSAYFQNVESPRRKKNIPEQFLSEKLIKLTKNSVSPHNSHNIERDSFPNREDITKSISKSSLRNSKHSQHISNRLARIQNSIARELQELRYR